MSITERTNASGGASWDIRPRESGRGSRARSRSFPTKRETQDCEANIRRVQRLGAHAPGEASSDRLEDWLTRWFTSNRVIWAPSMTTNRASHLDRWVVAYISGVRLRDLGPARLYEWRDQMIADMASPSTMSNVMRMRSSALGNVVDHDTIPANVLLGLQRPRVIREPRQPLSAEQAERIRAELPTQQDRVFWGLL